VFGSLVWLAPDPLAAAELEALACLCRTDRAGLAGEMACGPLDQGLVARYRGPSSQAARYWFTRIWARIRQQRGLIPPSCRGFGPFRSRPLPEGCVPHRSASTLGLASDHAEFAALQAVNAAQMKVLRNLGCSQKEVELMRDWNVNGRLNTAYFFKDGKRISRETSPDDAADQKGLLAKEAPAVAVCSWIGIQVHAFSAGTHLLP
jgi:hypothetical protein